MSSIPSITEWIETALTTVAVRPELRDNLREEIEQWLVTALSVQVSLIDFLRGWRRSLIFAYTGHLSGSDACGDVD
jgi:hypothetical protein